MLTNYTATIDVTTTLSAEQLADTVAPYHGTITQRGKTAGATITYPADDATQATHTALAIAQSLGTIISLDVTTTQEHDRRNGQTPIPDLMSVEDAASALGITRQAVVKRINAGTLQAVRVGRTWVVPQAALPAS